MKKKNIFFFVLFLLSSVVTFSSNIGRMPFGKGGIPRKPKKVGYQRKGQVYVEKNKIDSKQSTIAFFLLSLEMKISGGLLT